MKTIAFFLALILGTSAASAQRFSAYSYRSVVWPTPTPTPAPVTTWRTVTVGKPIVVWMATAPTPTPAPVVAHEDQAAVTGTPGPAVSPDNDEFYSLCRRHVLAAETTAAQFALFGDATAAKVFLARAAAVRELYKGATGKDLP